MRDQERQRVQDASGERAETGDRPAQDRVTTAGELTRVGEPLRVRHADACGDRGGGAGDESRMRVMRVQRDREDRRDRREGAVDQPGEGRLDTLEEEGLAWSHAYSV